MDKTVGPYLVLEEVPVASICRHQAVLFIMAIAAHGFEVRGKALEG